MPTYLLDTNLLLYAYDARVPAKQARALELAFPHNVAPFLRRYHCRMCVLNRAFSSERAENRMIFA